MDEIVKKALEEAVRGLQHKNAVSENILTVSGDRKEKFKIRVESPQVLILKIETSGCIKLSLVRSGGSGAFTAHVEGTVGHIKSGPSQEVDSQRSYRSDKGGYENSLNVSSGDVISITMEAHHCVSAVVGQGSSEMELNVKY